MWTRVAHRSSPSSVNGGGWTVWTWSNADLVGRLKVFKISERARERLKFTKTATTTIQCRMMTTCQGADRMQDYGVRSPLGISNNYRAFQVSRQAIQNRVTNANLYRLVTAYRAHGHKKAHLDPLTNPNIKLVEELDPTNYGFSDGNGNQNDTTYELTGILNVKQSKATLKDVLAILENTYCGPVAVEFQHLPEVEEREWFAHKYEKLRNEEVLTTEQRRQIAAEMLKSQAFDNFLAAKFGTVKRYGGEGAESMMAFFWRLFNVAPEYGIDQVVMCMPHRGRLNLLTGMLQYPPVDMFRKMRGKCEFPDNMVTTGDVLSHLTSSCDLLTSSGKSLHVTMIPNPSHLEAACPVAVGKVRAKQQALKDGSYSDEENTRSRVLCLQIHGDAAFSAQGIIMETLAQANVPHFTVSGSVHLVVNNQLGFTTPADWGRSSPYCTDIAKMILAPIIHVNGDYPEEVAKVASLALEYRQTFHKDIFLDLICFRRWGHNELDDPTFTNPTMYQEIHSRRSVPDLYSDQLVNEGVMKQDDVNLATSQYVRGLNEDLAKVEERQPTPRQFLGNWKEMAQPPKAIATWDTGVEPTLLKFLGARSVQYSKDFVVHPHLQKTHIQNRLNKLTEGQGLDWATAEALAIGSLLYQGFNVRLSGQDVGRGTFSHRHAALVHQNTGAIHVPLNYIVPNQKSHFEVASSILSEEAVLGFEYGASIEDPNNLIIWEAQFGDFFNGAQIIIDTFITAGETKWLLQSGLVMLLPHGYDGAGPEHSSCRLERFLQACDSNQENSVDGDDVNIHVVNPTTPAQYFHLLRRQMIRNYRRPLIVVAPKLLLRHPAAVSRLENMAPGTAFQSVIGDFIIDPDKVTRVIACTGKHYYALDKHRQSEGVFDTAIIRVESLCPFPVLDLQAEFRKYPKAKKFIWSQEEHQNMGAWNFVAPRFENLVGYQLTYVGRRPLAAPAVGISSVHQEESKNVLLLSYL